MSDPQAQLTSTTEDLWGHVKAANRGDKNALSTRQEGLSGQNAADLIATVGDLARQVETAALTQLRDQAGASAVVQAELS